MENLCLGKPEIKETINGDVGNLDLNVNYFICKRVSLELSDM